MKNFKKNLCITSMASLMLNTKSFKPLICCCFLFLAMQVLMGQIDPLPESDCPATFCPEGECLDIEAPIGTDPCIPRPSEQDCCGNVVGCGDICAANYNPSATFTDGSCEYLSFEVFWSATNLGTFNSCTDVLPVAPMDVTSFTAQGGDINAGPCAIIIVESIDDPAMENCINATINRTITIWDDAKNPNGLLDADEESFSRLFNFSIFTNEPQACDDGDPCTENDIEVVCDAIVCIPCAGTTILGCDEGNCSSCNANGGRF